MYKKYFRNNIYMYMSNIKIESINDSIVSLVYLLSLILVQSCGRLVDDYDRHCIYIFTMYFTYLRESTTRAKCTLKFGCHRFEIFHNDYCELCILTLSCLLPRT